MKQVVIGPASSSNSIPVNKCEADGFYYLTINSNNDIGIVGRESFNRGNFKLFAFSVFTEGNSWAFLCKTNFIDFLINIIDYKFQLYQFSNLAEMFSFCLAHIEKALTTDNNSPTIKNVNKSEITEKIFQTIQNQKFADWYTDGNFYKWIAGEKDAPDSDVIKQEIEKIFTLDKVSEPPKVIKGELARRCRDAVEQFYFRTNEKITAIKHLRDVFGAVPDGEGGVKAGLPLAEAKWAVENWDTWIKYVEENDKKPSINPYLGIIKETNPCVEVKVDYV